MASSNIRITEDYWEVVGFEKAMQALGCISLYIKNLTNSEFV